MRLVGQFLGAVGFALGLASCGQGGGPPERDAAPDRIVLVVVDTLRADHLSPYGAETATPNIQDFAERGQVFTRVVSSFHQTTMSMASLFTGRTPSLETGDPDETLDWTGRNWCGMRRFTAESETATCIPEGLPTLAAALREAGYWTAGVVTNALLFRPMGYERGFDRWVQVGDAPEEARAFQIANPQVRSAARANQAVAALLEQRPTDRFFLYVHYMDVHDYRLAGTSYPEAVVRVDRAFGRLLEQLRAHALIQGAVVVLTSDHGERLGEEHVVKGGFSHFGNPSFEEVLRVPLIISPPVSEDPTRFLRGDDLNRLIKRIAGAAEREPADLAERELFLSEKRYQTYRNEPWKSFRKRGEERLWLIDLRADPGERSDVSALHPEIAAEHARRMDELTASLAVSGAAPSRLTAEDERRLRALGYLE
jgi:arylsulfatase A-like enzyme